MKGSQDLVDAATVLLEQGRRLEVRFIGGEGWSSTGAATMTDWLHRRIPPQHQGSFKFVGPASRDELPRLTADAWAIVVSSRFESFCLAAHEARMMGHPVIVPDLPAFSGLFGEETGALQYDGSVAGLAEAMKRMMDDRGLAQRLGESPMPRTEVDWKHAYEVGVEPRHPRAQAGLATSATRRVNETWEASKSRSSSASLQRFYRVLPRSVARLAVRLAPRRLKDAARSHASWPAEAERRARQSRLDQISRRIGAGEFPELDDPDVTVVVPVFNDFRFIDEALASVYEQTYSSWEIVMVDDGSTDPAVIQYLESLHRPRLRQVRQENTGLPGARNTGMRLARGRFLVPLDSDDQLEPEFMSRMVSALDQHPQAGFAHCYARLHHDIDAFFVTRPFNPYWQLLGNGVAQCGLIRAEAWEAVGGYDETMVLGHEDWDFWMRLMEARWGQVQLTEVLYKYRKHGVSMSVDAEARFEAARRMVRDRHPRLYAEEKMRRFKKRWFPFVTVVADRAVEHDDWEYVSDVLELGSTWGKFVVDARALDPVPVEVIERLADALETEPKAARAVTTGRPPLVMTRRWNLHDRQATPDRILVVDDPQIGPEPSIAGHVPRPGWEVPTHLRDARLPIQRQPPEEAGLLPDPLSW
jgi:GT2 family glycosyltransferase